MLVGQNLPQQDKAEGYGILVVYASTAPEKIPLDPGYEKFLRSGNHVQVAHQKNRDVVGFRHGHKRNISAVLDAAVPDSMLFHPVGNKEAAFVDFLGTVMGRGKSDQLAGKGDDFFYQWIHFEFPFVAELFQRSHLAGMVFIADYAPQIPMPALRLVSSANQPAAKSGFMGAATCPGL